MPAAFDRCGCNTKLKSPEREFPLELLRTYHAALNSQWASRIVEMYHISGGGGKQQGLGPRNDVLINL